MRLVVEKEETNKSTNEFGQLLEQVANNIQKRLKPDDNKLVLTSTYNAPIDGSVIFDLANCLSKIVDKPVYVVDCHPLQGLSVKLGALDELGISNCMSEDADLNELIQSLKEKYVRFIPYGTESISAPGIDSIIKKMNAHQDRIYIMVTPRLQDEVSQQWLNKVDKYLLAISSRDVPKSTICNLLDGIEVKKLSSIIFTKKL